MGRARPPWSVRASSAATRVSPLRLPRRIRRRSWSRSLRTSTFSRIPITYFPLTDAQCLAPIGFRWDRQTNWIDGDYRHTLYDHYYTPNSTIYDCLRGPDLGWRTARSRHPGGVNALFVDGSVHFIKNTISLVTWRAIGTIAGGEVVSSATLIERDRSCYGRANLRCRRRSPCCSTPPARAHELWFQPSGSTPPRAAHVRRFARAWARPSASPRSPTRRSGATAAAGGQTAGRRPGGLASQKPPGRAECVR